MTLVLASGSQTRRTLMENAGLSFDVRPADVDERAVEQPLLAAGTPAREIASALAAAKALAGAGNSGELVIGADQVLELDGEILHKPADRAAAENHLTRLAGKSHHLHTAVAIAQNGDLVWSHLESPRLTMRDLSEPEMAEYLDQVGENACKSVGAYQIEGPGLGLFAAIEGDFFAILGLPMLPLMAFLRSAKDAA